MAQSTTSGTSSRRYMREHEVPSSSRYVDSEWESKEALRQRELEEARARAAQMEKTMRWWSDCTANWREKWSKVRNERNAARDEAKALRAKLEIAVKDANTFKHESQELELQNEQLKKEMEKIHMILLKHAGQFDQQIFTILESDPQLRATFGLDEQLEFYNNASDALGAQRDMLSCKNSHEITNVALGSHNILPERDIEEYVLQGAVPKHAVELYKESPSNLLDKNITKLVTDSNGKKDGLDKQQSPLDMYNEESLTQKMSQLQIKLEEATKTISVEREENNSLHRTVEKLKAEIRQLREQCEELCENKAEAMRELSELKERFQLELSDEHIADLIDDTSNGESMDRRLIELRTELEKLQVENAAEWSKRERLETEKNSLERENKLLRLKLYELQERAESRRPRPVSTADTDTRQLQHEILVRNMVLLEVKQYQATLKQSLAEKTTELSHAMRRSEQYEVEVKRVRARVEELKKELAVAQDEVDAATNSVRKLQRANEDLVEQLESANVQLEHFRNSNNETCEILVDTEVDGAEEQKFQANNSNEYSEGTLLI
ncbi:PREDICTED: coiled-coil domain-containing protein 102A isoform X2 [Cyphomyrmex costatus]|uniref:coiled-coil domain-containing protein 102A isoform X2 n=1 Tax=Cyphomyrmex costatus TaxID=456900 RepID=UPI000852300D|nr:PREDICTED: coiled-coil domain-containing protein 102A isoform X2 [Cyphomyrmex costatus]